MHTPPVFGMRIGAIASYAPKTRITNRDIALRLEQEKNADNAARRTAGLPAISDEKAKTYKTSDAWIRRYIGFTERRFAGEAEGTIDLGAKATRRLLLDADLDPCSIDAIIFATVTPSYRSSNPDATELQYAIGLSAYHQSGQPRNLYCVDAALACSSWTAALQIAYARIRSGLSENVLLIGADKMSTMINWRDRVFACVLGDAGTAAWCTAVPTEEDWFGVKHFWAWSHGQFAHTIRSPRGGSKQPLTSAAELLAYMHCLAMDGTFIKETFVPFMSERGINAALERVGWQLSDIDLAVMHEANRSQLNAKIIEHWQKQGFAGQVLDAGGMFGNTTTASIPLAMTLHPAELKTGRKFVCAGFGGGLSANITCGEIKHPLPVYADV